MAEPLPLVRIAAPAHRAWLGDRELTLPRLCGRLLVHFTINAGRAMSVEEIFDAVWGVQLIGNSKTVQMHVSLLRKVLGDAPANPRYITTVWGEGYRFEAAMLDPGSVFATPAPAAVPEGLSERLDRIEAALADLRDLIILDRQTAVTATGGGHG